jgi:hypothetical protein
MQFCEAGREARARSAVGVVVLLGPAVGATVHSRIIRPCTCIGPAVGVVVLA